MKQKIKTISIIIISTILILGITCFAYWIVKTDKLDSILGINTKQE